MPVGGDLVLDLALLPSAHHGCYPAMPDPLREQVHLGTAIPQAREELHPTALPLALTRAPGRGQCGDERGIIPAKAAGDGLERWEVRDFGLRKPRVDRRSLSRGQQGLNAAFARGSMGEHGMGPQEARQGVPLRSAYAGGGRQEQPDALGGCKD